MTVVKNAKFGLGQVVSTPGAIEALDRAGQTPWEFVGRHIIGDWGIVCEQDRQANDDALIDGSRLLSAYTLKTGEKIWIITEAVDDNGERAATTLLLPDEY